MCKLRYSTQIIIQNQRKDKEFSDKLNQKQCINTKPTLKEMLKGFLYEKKKKENLQKTENPMKKGKNKRLLINHLNKPIQSKRQKTVKAPITTINSELKRSLVVQCVKDLAQSFHHLYSWWKCNLVRSLWKTVRRLLKTKNRTTI